MRDKRRVCSMARGDNLALLLWGKTDGDDEPDATEPPAEYDISFCILENNERRNVQCLLRDKRHLATAAGT